MAKPTLLAISRRSEKRWVGIRLGEDRSRAAFAKQTFWRHTFLRRLHSLLDIFDGYERISRQAVSNLICYDSVQ